MTGEGLSVLLRVSFRVQSILPPYRTDHFRGARRHVLTPLHPDDSQSEKTSSHSHLLPATVSLSFSLTFFSFFLSSSATRGFATTIFTGLQTDERFSLKPIRFADDSRYIRSCTLSRFREPMRCNPMQQDTT